MKGKRRIEMSKADYMCCAKCEQKFFYDAFGQFQEYSGFNLNFVWCPECVEKLVKENDRLARDSTSTINNEN